MIRILQLKLPVEADQEELRSLILKKLDVPSSALLEYSIVRRSVDARKGRPLSYVYAVDAKLKEESLVWKRLAGRGGLERLETPYRYRFPEAGRSFGTAQFPRPVVVGFGPAGIFCALLLARAGAAPLVVERGKPVDQRWEDVRCFWKNGILQQNSNVQFGEGGAGTFSDGKLTTLVRDRDRRGRFVLEELVKAGAPEEILYVNKPHIGTDGLIRVMRGMREEILRCGGEIRFETTLSGIRMERGTLRSILLEQNDGTENGVRREEIEASHVFLGIGHSARDTFQLLEREAVPMEAKAFSVGLRVEQLQREINQVQYRSAGASRLLGPADYKLAHRSSSGRGAYTFCMCPGGLVVAAASEAGGLVTNGMSHFRRDGENANAAVLVTVTPADFRSYGQSVLAGVAFQRDLERKAYRMGGSGWKAPVQLAVDFCRRQRSSSLGKVSPTYSCGVALCDLWELFPSYLAEPLREGLLAFEQQLPGFIGNDAVLTGVETRSSSPVRILRDETMQSQVRGLFPIGEGAGYAGGIVSAAIDGMKAAECYAKLVLGAG